MFVRGANCLRMLLREGDFSAKMVFNRAGAIIFPVSGEHRDQKMPGISYEDDYRGNALAAMLCPGKIEVRYHEMFSDENVRTLLDALFAEPELFDLVDWELTYQGRRIDPGADPNLG